jgi:xanthine dehydrogenase accessory factor
VALVAGATGPHPTGHADRAAVPAATPAPASPGGAAVVEVKAVKVVAGTPPCEVGAAMAIEPGGVVRGSLGCAEFDAQAVEAAGEVWDAGTPSTRVLHHDLGDVEVYLEPRGRAPRVIVVSATDVARALRAILATLGWDTVLVEPRVERVGGDGPAASSLEGVSPVADDAIVLTDHDAPGVADTIAAALEAGVRFVGVMGSRRHVGAHVEELRTRGLGEDALARVRSPLGLDLGGRRPEEIAVSIAAGLVADRHGRAGGWLDR